MALFSHNEEIWNQTQFPKFWFLIDYFSYSRVLIIVRYVIAITYRKVILNMG